MPLIRVRMIAMENPVVALLMDASDWQPGPVPTMPGCISRWLGLGHHTPRVHAVTPMTDPLRRRVHFRGTRPS